MSLRFRLAGEQDAEPVHRLIQAAFAEYARIPVTPGALLETLEEVRRAAAQGRVVVAVDSALFGPAAGESKGAIAATARFERRADSLYVGRVAVHPEYRRRGVGAALMREMERLAAGFGLRRIVLATRDSMPANLAFYASLGYEVVRREPHPRGPDVIVWLEKQIAPGPACRSAS